MFVFLPRARPSCRTSPRCAPVKSWGAGAGHGARAVPRLGCPCPGQLLPLQSCPRVAFWKESSSPQEIVQSLLCTGGLSLSKALTISVHRAQFVPAGDNLAFGQTGISEGFLILHWAGKCCSVSLPLPPKLSRNRESLSEVRQELCRPKALTSESPAGLGAS